MTEEAADGLAGRMPAARTTPPSKHAYPCQKARTKGSEEREEKPMPETVAQATVS